MPPEAEHALFITLQSTEVQLWRESQTAPPESLGGDPFLWEHTEQLMRHQVFVAHRAAAHKKFAQQAELTLDELYRLELRGVLEGWSGGPEWS